MTYENQIYGGNCYEELQVLRGNNLPLGDSCLYWVRAKRQKETQDVFDEKY